MVKEMIRVEKGLVELGNFLESRSRRSNPSMFAGMIVYRILDDLLKLCKRGEAFPKNMLLNINFEVYMVFARYFIGFCRFPSPLLRFFYESQNWNLLITRSAIFYMSIRETCS